VAYRPRERQRSAERFLRALAEAIDAAQLP
jgi:hypothetical protein